MGTTQSTDLNTDTEGVPTSGEYANRGDGTSKWLQWFRAGDGGIATMGATTDAAATTGNGTLVAILKAIRDSLAILCGLSTNASTTALAASLVVKASAGRLRRVSGYSTTAQFLHVYNATSLPANGVAPAVCIPIAANVAFSIDFGSVGRSFSTGIVVGVSSTGPTKTVGGADTWIDAQYV